ncbi:MAG: hypothetical protein KAI33_10885, partial [Elusimicrobiales bacterium]|nr:hypothetical protein [Elusimicrobiales bacterium]
MMDFATILGVLGLAAFLFAGIVGNGGSSSLLNMHAVVMVLGGTLIALLINTPRKYLIKAISETKIIFFDRAES